jgi:menaquinone-dependent protoporphyrinogen oxidase
MSIKTAIIYAPVDGQTLKICTRLAEGLSREDHSVEIFSIEEFSGDIREFDKIMIASSIRYGKHNEKIQDFIAAQKAELEKKKSAFFSVNLVARKPEKATSETNPYVNKFLTSIDWVPNQVGIFAGKLDYKKYSLSDRLLIQLIMLMTGGPLRSGNGIEFTDWKKVDEFGELFSKM